MFSVVELQEKPIGTSNIIFFDNGYFSKISFFYEITGQNIFCLHGTWFGKFSVTVENKAKYDKDQFNSTTECVLLQPVQQLKMKTQSL